MAISPRCYTSGFASSAQYNLPLTGWTNAGAGVSGTAPVPGDVVLLALMDNTSGGTVSQIAGSPFVILNNPTQQNNAGSFWAVWATRTWTGGETVPSFSFTSGNRLAWVAVAFAPDAGQMAYIDVAATEKVDSTPATSHQANSATATGTGETSVVAAFISAAAQSTTAITVTAPTSYTQIALANNIGTSGQYVDAAAMWYRTGLSGTVAPGSQTFTGSGNTNAVLDHILLREVPAIALADQGAATEALLSGAPTSFPELAAGTDTFVGQSSPPYPDVAGAVDDIPGVSMQVSVAISPAEAEAGGAADILTVSKLPVPTPIPGVTARIASPAFIRSAMPRMHLQNLMTGQWLHHDVQGVTAPSITWQLNAPDSFTCTLAPPRPDLLDPTGNPIAQVWRDACYLEENDEIKFGGILTGSTFSGPQWQLTFSGFMGFPTGIPYEGPDYVRTRIDALDVVRDLWTWLQSQPNSNLGMVLDPTESGTLLGAVVPQGANSTLAGAAPVGATVIKVHSASGFAAKQIIEIAPLTSQHTIKSISGNSITLDTGLGAPRNDGAKINQVLPATPIAIYWYNSTDIGQEIGNIQTDAVFDMWETHEWTSAARTGVKHRLHFGVPRSGKRQTGLRFAEGENIVSAVQGSQDGSTFANDVIGLGSGQGKAQIRATVAQVDGHLRRVLVYTDQTVTTVARMQSKAQKILASRLGLDTPTSVVVINHPNAPFGSFVPGDDIYVQWVTGWRNTAVWCRITQMTQDPTTNLMTLTLARSDSFTYLAQSGQAGTI